MGKDSEASLPNPNGPHLPEPGQGPVCRPLCALRPPLSEPKWEPQIGRAMSQGHVLTEYLSWADLSILGATDTGAFMVMGLPRVFNLMKVRGADIKPSNRNQSVV